MYFVKNDQLPALVHDHVILNVHLGPQHGFQHFQNHKIRFPLGKLTKKHVPYVNSKNDQLPALVHDHVILNVHLGPQDGFQHS